MSLMLIVSTFISATTAASLAIVLGDDGRTDSLDLLMLVLDLLGVCLWVRVDPLLTILECILDLLLLIGVHLLAQTLVLTGALYCRLHGVHVAIEGILGINTFL